MKLSSGRWAVLVLLVLSCGGGADLNAQTTNATLSGTVSDPSGKVVPAVEVTVFNMDTGVSSNAHTNSEARHLAPLGEQRA